MIWSKLKSGLVMVGALVLAVGAALLYGWRRGAHEQADHDTATQAKAEAATAVTAARTYSEANEAAQAVQEHAQTAPAPDVKARDDFESLL